MKPEEIAFVIAVAVIIFDIWLEKSGRKTISKHIHDLFPQWLDYIIMISIVVGSGIAAGLIWKGMWGWRVGILAGIFVTVGHFFWHEDDWPPKDK